MTDQDTRTPEDTSTSSNGLFKKHPKLGVILVAVVAYALLLAMCVVVAILIIRG